MSQYVENDFTFGDVLTEAKAQNVDTQYKKALERARPLGGIPEVGVTSETYVDIPGVIIVPIGVTTIAQMHLMALVSGGTGSVRLWNIDEAEEVADSEMTLTDTTPVLLESPDLSLVAGDTYKLQAKISDDAEYVIAYGAALVTQ